MFFVDSETGEVFEAQDEADAKACRESPDRFVEVPAWEFLSPPEFSAPDVEIVDRDWVLDWYMKRRLEVEARVAARKAAYQAGAAEDGAVLRALDWRYLSEVQAQADELLAAQKGKKKSVTTTYGKVGYRKATKIEVTDAEAVILWCLERDENHPAVKLTPSILKKQLPVEDIPGVKWPSGDTFFAKPAGV